MHSKFVQASLKKIILFALFCAVIQLAFAAQSPDQNVTVTGPIQSIVSDSAHRPAGMHVLVSGSNGTVDACLGSFVSHDVQQSLREGTSIEVTGSNETVNGNEYLLVRQMTVGGRQILIRNEHGFLVHAQSRKKAQSAVHSTNVNGGAL
jgi:hypothetical protein